MPYIEVTYHKYVHHIGFLEDAEERKPSLDGPGIPVTTHPESWRAIRGLNGPELVLSFPAGQWIDAMTFSDEDIAEMQLWCEERRYVRRMKAWHALVPKGDEAEVQIFLTRKEAAAAVGLPSDSPELDAAIWEDETCKITPKGLKALERWPGPFVQWEQAVIALYTRLVLVVKRPWVVGVWWSEPDNAEAGCAPSGYLFPERLHHFEVENEEGDVMDFDEMFPDFNAPEDPYVEYE